MQYLEEGTHRFSVPALYDRASQSYAAPVLHVARLPPAPLPRAVQEEIAYQSLEAAQPGAVRFLETLDPLTLAQAPAYLDFQAYAATLGLGFDSIADAQVLYCDTACYHDDSAFNTIFAAMHLAGAHGDVVFPRLEARVHMTPGALVLFDCREPHAFLPEGLLHWPAPAARERSAGSAQTQMLSVDLDPLHPEVRRLFGLRQAVRFDPQQHFDMTYRKVCPMSGRYL